jgi:hypothetical protein
VQAEDLINGLPGEALIREGLEDWHSGRRTIAACLVEIARPRLARIGLIPGQSATLRAEEPLDPELRLYALLRQEDGDAYSRYNALLRELVSFEQALDRRANQVRS